VTDNRCTAVRRGARLVSSRLGARRGPRAAAMAAEVSATAGWR